MKFKFPLVVCLLTSVFSFLRAQDAAPVDVKAVLGTLKDIKQKQHDNIQADEIKLAADFMAKSTDGETAVAYYEDAVRGTQFAGQSHEGKEYLEWKKKQEERLKNKDFRMALSLHLMYLSLSISHDSGVKVKDQLAALVNYTQMIVANEDALNGEDELMKQPLSNSIFVHWFQIGQYVADTKTWEPVPININGIFEKVILPEYRRTKSSGPIFQYWDQRLEKEADRAAKSGRTFEVDKFNQTTRPVLLWQRAQEYVGLGMPNQAITDMLAVIKANPYHPNAPDWVSQVENMVKASIPVAAAVSTPAPTPIPPVAATPAPAPAAAATTPAATAETGPAQN